LLPSREKDREEEEGFFKANVVNWEMNAERARGREREMRERERERERGRERERERED